MIFFSDFSAETVSLWIKHSIEQSPHVCVLVIPTPLVFAGSINIDVVPE